EQHPWRLQRGLAGRFIDCSCPVEISQPESRLQAPSSSGFDHGSESQWLGAPIQAESGAISPTRRMADPLLFLHRTLQPFKIMWTRLALLIVVACFTAGIPSAAAQPQRTATGSAAVVRPDAVPPPDY